MTSIVEMVHHYQRSIEKSLENPSRLMHCIQKLNKLPITVEHLQETGVGRTVNNLRKYDGEVGYASKALVTKWKAMVANEEAANDSHESQEETHETGDGDMDVADDDEDRLKIDEMENIEPAESSSEENQQENAEINNKSDLSNHHKSKSSSKNHTSTTSTTTTSSSSSSDKKHKHKDHHRSSEHNSNSSSSSSKKHKERDRHKESSSSSHKKDKEKEHHHRLHDKSEKDTKSHSKHHSSSKDTITHKSSSQNKSDSESKTDSSKKSHHHHREKDSKSSSSSHHDSSKKSSKKDKESDKSKDSAKKRKRENTSEIIIDSTMGASFADALGMLDAPSSSKSKKTLPPVIISQPQASTSNSNSNTNKQKSTSSSSTTTTTNNKKLTDEPELLTKRAKLAPLPDLVSDIPAPTFTISNNYKPMPLNQTVMDCVFNSAHASRPMKQMTDEEALQYSISSNKSRTKVFSGAKSGIRGKVDSLFNMCLHVLQDHIDYLEYTGGVPFDIIKPVLERATVEQLSNLEDFNPYLIGDTDCLWEQHCKRRFRGKRPEELESWREMFLRCLDEEQAKFSRLTENIKLARDQKLPVRKTKLAYVDSVVKPPRGVKSKQVKYGTDTLPNVTPAARVDALKNIGGNSASIGDRRLKIAAELRNSIPIRGKKRSKSYEDDPDWTPTSWYKTLHKKPKKSEPKPVIKKSIDMIRYDRARAEAKRREEERRRQKSRNIRSESAPD